jgi:hypothetical protein
MIFESDGRQLRSCDPPTRQLLHALRGIILPGKMAIKLRDHPGLLDGWPAQPGGAYVSSTKFPIDGVDTLQEVFLQLAVDSADAGLALETTYRGARYTRDLRVCDDNFAEKLSDFVRQHGGETIEEIGNLEVSF